MPLFRISVLALLLLPLSLSCDSRRSPADVRRDYSPVVETELNNTEKQVAILLQNTYCKVKPRPRLPTCSDNVTNILCDLHNLTCKMKNLEVPGTDKLIVSVLTSLRSPCLERPTKEPSRNRRTTTTRPRKNGGKRCRVKAILSRITECYQILNTLGPN